MSVFLLPWAVAVLKGGPAYMFRTKPVPPGSPSRQRRQIVFLIIFCFKKNSFNFSKLEDFFDKMHPPN